MNLQENLRKLALRRSDHALVSDQSIESFNKSILEESFRHFSSSNNSERIRKYVLDSMAPVSDKSTKISFDEGNKVKKHLIDNLGNYGLSADYRFQGSVINNTHIKGSSDIDLLVFTDKFVTLENPQVPKSLYKGNPITDLQELKNCCEDILNKVYNVAVVETGNKSIKLSGGSLRRDIDVVPANWFDTNDYTSTHNEDYRGVYVLNSEKQIREKNYPFLNRNLLSIKD